MNDFYIPHESVPGWIGSFDDFKSTICDFRELRDMIISDEIVRLENLNVDSLRKGNISADEFLSTLNNQINELKEKFELTLTLKSEVGAPLELKDSEIDDKLIVLNLRRIKAFELEIGCGLFGGKTGNYTNIKLIVSDETSYIAVRANYDNSDYVSWIQSRLSLTRSKLRIIRSNFFQIVTLISVSILSVVSIFLLPNFTTLPIQIIASLGVLFLQLFIIYGLFKILKTFVPRFEIHANDKSDTLTRSLKWLIPVIIGLVGAIAAILALKVTD